MNLKIILKEVFGFLDFRPGQEEIIKLILNKKHILAVLSTGAGKSLCYQLPAVALAGRTIVVSPLIALMNDQTAHLQSLKIPADKIHSHCPFKQNQNTLQAFIKGKVKNKKHHKLPTFGKGVNHSKNFWELFARQLLSSGNINIAIEQFGALKITQNGEDILYGRKKFFYKDLIPLSVVQKKQKTKKANLEKKYIPLAKPKPESLPLLSSLKKLRRQLAQKKGVPAYIIFSDRTLIEMSNLKPQSLEEMLFVNGVGKHKLELYGSAFLNEIKNSALV